MLFTDRNTIHWDSTNAVQNLPQDATLEEKKAIRASLAAAKKVIDTALAKRTRIWPGDSRGDIIYAEGQTPGEILRRVDARWEKGNDEGVLGMWSQL